jgi:hypothetical protein
MHTQHGTELQKVRKTVMSETYRWKQAQATRKLLFGKRKVFARRMQWREIRQNDGDSGRCVNSSARRWLV